MKQSSVFLNFLRRHINQPVTAALAVLFPLWTVQVQGATFYWDGDTNGANASIGGSGTWDTTLNNWDPDAADNSNSNNAIWSNASKDIAFFGGGAGTVTLGTPITAGGLVFDSDGYVIMGDTLTLAAVAGLSSPIVNVAAFKRATIDSLIAGTAGLTKTGNGTLALSNTANTFSGDVVINGGGIVITNQAQLGTGTTAISVNGLANTGSPGYSGGQLVLNGGITGLTINREISVTGRGVGAANGSAGLISVGNNTITGDFVLGSTGTEGRALATHGVTTLTGGVQLGSGGAELFYGNGNWIISGIVTGFDPLGDRFVKTGNLFGTTLWLQNDANNFAQPLRIDSGTVRVGTVGALGSNTGLQSLDFNGGVLELRTEQTDFSSKEVRKRGNAGGIFVDHSIGGSSINQTLSFGNLLLDANANFTLTGRNGLGASFNGGAAAGGTAIDWASGGTGNFTNSSSGLLTINADVLRRSETTARNFTVTGSGDTRMTGNFLQLGTGAVSLVKDGVGTFTLLGTASTATGITTVNNGTLALKSFGGLPSGELRIGNATTTAGALDYQGAGETSSKAITINTTTANAYINANGSGALVLTGTITALAGAKTLVLGGASTASNEIQSSIPLNATNLQKIGTGTWVLSGANLYTGTTTVSSGTLQLKDTFSGSSRNGIVDTSNLIFNVDTFSQGAGGTFEYLGDGANPSAESVGSLLGTAGAGTVKVTAGGGGTAALTFSSLGTISAGSGINFVTNAGGSVVLTGAADINGILNAHLYYNGADFASGSAVTAATYTAEAAGASLAASNTNPYLVNTTDIAAQATAIINAGIKFDDTRNLTLAGGATLTIRNGATVSGGILVTGGSSVVISGGTGITSGGASDLVFRTDGVGDTLTLNTPITAASTLGWTKLGAGTLVLGAANAGTTGGQIHINEGTVQLSGSGRLGADSMDVRLRQGATLDLNGVNLGTAASATAAIDELNGAGTVTNSAAATTAILRVGSANTSSFFTGTIEDGLGQISLVKSGSGTFWLSGAQSYTGVVQLIGGNLDVTSLANIGVASGLGLGDATSDVTNAASLVFNGGALRYIGQNTTNTYQTTQSPSVNTNRLFTLAGNGTIASFGSYGKNDSSGRASNHAALVFSNTAAVAFSGAGNRLLDLRGDSLGDNIMGLQLIDNPTGGLLSVRKFDSGLWILTNASNSYTGDTLIGGGALQAQDGSSLSTNSNLVIDGGGGIFQTSGTFTRALGTGANEVRFGAINLRGGFAASTAPLIVNLGTSGLVWGSSNSPTAGTTHFLGAGTLYLSSSTALADVTFVNDFEVTQGIDKPITVTTALNSTTVTLTGGTTTDGLTVGQAISGANIPAGAFIASVNTATQISLSVNATAAGTGTVASVSGAGVREIRVDDNGNTGLDYATVSGVISGAGGLGKVGGGLLILNDANTYSGNTLFREGGLFVSSIGAAGATSSSLGTNVSGGILELGNPGTNTTVSLMYVGPGEVATRKVAITGTTGTRRIDSSGSGALVLTNLVHTSADSVTTTGGAKILEIRGNNTDGNRITSVLANNGGILTINKFDSGTWILDPTSANTFTGILTAGAGTLGLTADGIGSASRLDMSNAAIFAYGGDLTTSIPMQLNNNTAAVFTGSHNITLDGTVTKQAGANDQTFSNNLENGAVLTINGNFVNDQNAVATRNINVRGFGSTVWNGLIQNNSTAGALTRFDIRIANEASFTLGGDNKGAALGFTGGIVLGQGTLIVAHTGGLGPTANNVILSGGVLTAAVDLSGASKITNNVFLQGDPVTINGTQNIEFGGSLTHDNADRNLVNNLSGGAILTLSGGVNLSQDATSRTLTVRGTGDTLISSVIVNGSTAPASAFRMRGTGTVELTAANTYDGATAVENGVLKLGGAGVLDQNSVITVSGSAVLRLDNATTNNGNRVSDTRDINLDHGTLDFIGNAAGSTESLGRLDINGNGLAKVLISGGDSTLTFLSVNFANTGSALDLSTIASLGSNNKILFTTAPSGIAVSNGILPRVVIGSDFAEYDVTNGVRAFTGYNNSNNLGTALATATMNLTAAASVTGSQTVNALRLDHGTGVTVGSTVAGVTLTLTSGGLIATGGGIHRLSVPIVNSGANGAFFQVSAGTTLEVDSVLTGAAFTALQGGSINFNTQQFFTSTTNLHGGTLKLNGGLNTIMPLKQAIFINPGATLDLNGNVQFAGNILTSSVQPGAGGSIISSTGTGTIVTDNGGNWMGVISGSVNLGRVGGGTLTIGTAQTYTGWTFLTAGATTLRDEGTLANTSGIDINLATLTLSNNENLQTQNNNRINDAAAITLRSGTLNVNGLVNTAASETLGAITAAMGANVIQSATGGTGSAGAFTSQDLRIESLTRSGGATVNFANSTALGGIGNFPRIVFTTAPTTYLGGALGAWAIANSSDYAAYNSTNGVGTLGNGGYTGYDATFASGNITQVAPDSIAPFTTTLSGTTTTALLRLGGVYENNIAFTAGGNVLNLELGGLLRQNAAFSSSIGTSALPGVLTAGGTENSGVRELIIYSNTNGNPNFTGYTINVGATVISGSNTQGLLPGMTVTNANFPAGTTIVSVDSLNLVTVSQASINTTGQGNQTLTSGSFITGTQATGSNIVSMNSTVGIAAGMTITGTGVLANSYVVSVDSATQLTLSQNATTSIAGTASYTLGLGNIIVNSVIADNGSGNSVQLVKSGNGVLNLFANNTYTGGTLINQGIVNLFGSGVIIPNGGITIIGTVLNTISSGQIASGNSINLVGSSTLTLVGNNTLDSINFNHIGGTGAPTVTTNGVLTLTNATPIDVTNINSAVGVPTVNGFLDFGAGAKTINVGAIQLNGVVYDETVNRSLNIGAIISGNASITKTGAGLLGLGGQSTFSGGLTIAEGTLVIFASSTSTVPNTLVSGPLGSGLVSMAAGTRLSVDDNSRIVANAFSFAGDPIFGNVGGSTDTLTLNGALTFATLGTSGLVVNVETPYLNVALAGPLAGLGTVTSIGGATGVNTIVKSGPGNVTVLNVTGLNSAASINITNLTNTTAFSLLHDGDSTRKLETLDLGAISWVPPTSTENSVLTLSIGRAGTGVYYATPAWKILAPSSFTSSLLPNGLTLTVADGYGLKLVDDIALRTVATNTGATFNVSGTNTSLLPPGLTLDGLISGGPTGATARPIIKAGTGTLVLGNALNTFGGSSSIIDITDGLIQVASNGALGDSGNIVRISANNALEGLRVSGTFATSREINLNGASSGIDVTGSNVLTLNSAFTFATATNDLRKNDLGTLVLTQAQTGWDGVLTIGQGTLRLMDGAALGTTTGNLIINNVGASLELPGGVTVADAIRIASTNNSSSNGVNSSGAIRSMSGTNTLTGAITIDTTTADNNTRSGTLVADLGSTLEVQGGIVLGLGMTGTVRDNWVGFGGEGTINLTTTGITRTGTLGLGTLTKFGSGTLNLQVANAFDSQQVIVKSGVLSLNGAGTLGASTLSAPGTVFLNPTGILTLDNTGTNVNNRLSGRLLNISGADLNIIGNGSAATTETVGLFTLREGSSFFTLTADAAQQLDFTTGTITRSAQATLIVRGSNLGNAAGAGVATIAGGAYVFIGQTGGTGSTNKSILPWAFGDTNLLTGGGTFFLTSDSAAAGANTGTNILRALTAGEQVTNLATALANVNLSTNEALSSLTTFNSLRLDSGGGVTLNYVPLALDSGGLLVLAGNTGITGFSGVSYLTTTSNRELDLHTVGNITLDIPIAGTTGALTKSGAGTLTLAAGNTNHSTVMVNDGTLKLGGGDQTILYGRNMYVNEGGTLDLNGTVQQVNFLESRYSPVLARNDSNPPFGGGTVSNSSVTQATLAMATASSVFAGQITGNIAVVRSTAAGATVDWNLYTEQTYTGPTLYNGGRVILADTASLSATTSIEISNATFLITSSNNTTEPGNLTNRINDAASITLSGAMLQFRNRAALYTTETFGDVILKGGNSIFDFAEGGSGVNQSDIFFASFAREAGSHTTVRFLNIDGQLSGLQRLFFNSLNGVATTNVGDGLTNNLIGGWATFEREFASYTPGMGVGGLNTGGFAGYSPIVNPNLGGATDNIRIALPAAGALTVLTADRTLNSLNLQASTSATDDSTLNLGGFTLTLASGGLILSPVATTALLNSINVVNGSLTAGTTASPADLYINALQWFNNQADNTGNADVRIDASIVNNSAGGVVTLVIAGNTGRGTLVATNDVILTGNNTYTGGTFINSGQVRLNNTTADGVTNFAITGDLTIAGGYSSNPAIFSDRNTTVIFDSDSQIANTATATVMGGAILNLNNRNQTLAALVFDNNGGTTPQVTTGTGTLTLTGNITAGGQNLGSTSQINGKLTLSAATTTITVNPVEWLKPGDAMPTNLNPYLPNLTINAPITGGNIIKAGAGILLLSGANGFTGDFDLQAGGVLLGNNNALSGGTLTIGNNTTLSSTADNRVIANAYNVSGNFGLIDIFNLTMSGAGALAAGNHDINVQFATKSLTLSGILSGATASINKIGDGILILSNNSNSYGGSTTVSDGTLVYGGVDVVPTGSALTVLEGALVNITSGGPAITVGSLAGNSATQGGVIVTTATSGTVTFTAGANNTSTAFGGVLTNGAGSTLNFVKVGTGTLTLGGANQYNGTTTVADGRLVAKSVGGSSPLGTSQSVILGGTTTSGILQLGDSAAPLDLTFNSVATQGAGTLNKFVGGNTAASTLTLDVSTPSLLFANIGDGGTNESNLNLVKNGASDLSFAGTGTSTFNGSTTVNNGKLFMNTPGAFSATTSSLTLADGTEFSLRGTTNAANQVFGFSGTGNKITVGSSTGATLGFALDGGFNSQLNLAAGQTMTVTGTLTTAIYVNSAPIGLQDYVLINGTDAASLGSHGAFDLNPVIFNGGSFTYALRFGNGINGGGADQWVLTPTAVPSAPDTWWMGDLIGLGTGVWSATTTSGTGSPSNWATDAGGLTDALVPPDQNSIVHFSATGAANFTTTLGAHMTIQELIFHTGNVATTIGTSNGVNTLTLGNTVDPSGITLQTGVGNVGISVEVILAQDQSWNIEDTARTLTLSAGLAGTAKTLTINDAVTNAGSLIITGTAGTLTGTLNMHAGSLIFDDGGSLSSGADVVLGTTTKAATLQVGSTTAATNAIIGGLGNGSFTGSRVIGGNATTSTLTIGATSGSQTFTAALGGLGTNENNFNLAKDGAGTQILNGAATYTGTTTVRQGILQLGAASTFAPTGALAVIANAGTTATMDFNGKNFSTTGVLTLGGGTSGIAQIIGTGSTLTLGGDIVFDALNDPGAAVISTNLSTGARTITVGESVNAAIDLSLNGTLAATGGITIAGAGSGAINGAWTLAGTNLSNTFNSTGTWDFNAVTNTTGTGDWNINTGVINATVSNALNAADDIIIDGTGTPGSATINISGTAGTSGIHQGDDIFIRNGGLINVTVNNGISTGTDQLVIGDTASTTAGSAGVLNLAANINVGAGGLVLGTNTNIGNITGTGILTTAGNKDLRNGLIEAGITLAGNGAIFKQNTGTVTFAGDRATASTGATHIREGRLILDYTTNNNSKIGGVLNLGLATILTNATLTLNGNASAATIESVVSTTILNGNTFVDITNGAGQTATLNLNAITRTTPGGAVFFSYSSTDAKATSTSPAGTLGWATLVTGAGVQRFAAIDGSGDIVQATLTTQNAVSLWSPGQDIINSGAFTGTVACAQISSLTFAALATSTVNITSTGHLVITSGGIMVDSAVGALDMKILGGSLFGSTSGALGEIIVHQNNAVGTLTIGSNIVNSIGITKTGVGTLILTGNNSFRPTGSQLNINAGTVQLSGGNAIGDNTAVWMRVGTTLNLNNSAETIGHLNTLSGTTIALGTSGALTLNQTTNTTFTSALTGGATSSFILNSFGFNFNINQGITTTFTGRVVINSGLLQLSGGGRLSSATAFTINKGGNLLIDNNGTTLSGDRILNTATITLNSADGVFGTQTQPRGLAIRTDQDTTLDETVGVVTANSGASYVTLEATTINDDSDIIMTNLVRANSATLNVRGTNLGSTNANNNQFRIGNGGNETAFIGTLVGGGGAAGTQNISIVPWAIGESTPSATVMAVTNMGNSLVTYVAGAGIRPLDFATEYDTYAAAAATDNVRESLSADLTGLSGKTINSLVIHKNSTGAGAINVTGTGVGQSLINTSGAFLFTQNTGAAVSTAHSVILGGFDDGIQVGAANEYVISVVNPSSATNTATMTAKIDSSLNTNAASVTKSGRGTLEFTAVNTYGGGTTINEGTVLVHQSENLGTGGVTLAGGTLSLAADFASPLTTATLNLLSGGGTLEVLASSVVATDLAITGSGPLTKIGTGTLQLTGTTASTNTGDFNVRRGTLELNKTAGVDAIGGGTLFIGFSTTTNETATVKLLADNQINNATNVSVRSNATGAVGTFDLNDRAETIGSLTLGTITGSGVIVRTGAAGVLTVTGDITLSNDRNTNDTGTNPQIVKITGTGSANTGTLDLGGATRTITVQPNSLSVATTIGLPDAAIETVIQNGGVIKEGSRILYLSGDNTYTGGTTINNGGIELTGNLAAGTVTVSKTAGSLTDAAVLSGGGNGTTTGVIGGPVTLGEVSGGFTCGVGVLTPGITISGTANANGTLTLTAGGNALTVNDGSQIQMGITSATFTSSGLVAAFGANTAVSALDYLQNAGSGEIASWNANAGNRDFINLTGAASSLSIGTRASGTFGDGSVVVSGASLATLAYGQVFNLIDWTGLVNIGGTFNTGSSSIYDATASVQAGDLDLVALGAGFAWDVSAFAQYGVVVVVPEPSRALLLLCGLLGLMLRRRRRAI